MPKRIWAGAALGEDSIAYAHVARMNPHLKRSFDEKWL
jgi:hypothetical protein